MLKRLLTILFAVVAVGFAGTSHAQYMFLDTDADGVSTPNDKQ